jgi:hypothetical protein
MRFIPILSILIIIPICSNSQEKNDVGILAGASYYMGDYNQSTLFYMASPAMGVMIRHNVNEFYSIRFSGSHSQLKGVYNANSHYLPSVPSQSNFSNPVVEVSSVLEIGFRPFGTKQVDAHRFSPYVTLGVSIAYIQKDVIESFSDVFVVNLPFGVGLKYTPFNRWTFGAELRLHKTFNDNIDGYRNISYRQSLRIHNYDWIGFGGLFVSYRLVNKGAVCPVYD